MIDSNSQIQSGRRDLCWWQYALLAMLLLLAISPFDLPIARFCYTVSPSRGFLRIVELVGDAGGYGLTVLAILLAAVALSRTKISRLPLLVSMSLGAGLVADLLKLCVARGRPHSIDLTTATFGSTFYGLFPFFSVPSGQQSFPSGHAATAFGFAIALSLLYPRGRRYFIAFAVIVSLTRVILHAHFPTDVTAGALLGVTWAYFCCRGFGAPVFAWCERTIDSWIAQYKNRRQVARATCGKASEARPSAQLSSSNKSDVRDAA